jgi:hypothetical protein
MGSILWNRINGDTDQCGLGHSRVSPTTSVSPSTKRWTSGLPRAPVAPVTTTLSRLFPDFFLSLTGLWMVRSVTFAPVVGSAHRTRPMIAPPATTRSAALVTRRPMYSLRPITSAAKSTAQRDPVAFSGETTLTRPRSNAASSAS